ncbi:MAG: hypothetical protein WC980_04155 [Candidatus Brocadiia bacterium]
MKKPDEVTTCEFLYEHVYSKPGLYEPDFQKIRPYLIPLRCFGSLRHLAKFALDNKKAVRESLAADLKALARLYPWMRNQILEVLLFVCWPDLARGIETDDDDERFYQRYTRLIEDVLGKIE